MNVASEAGRNVGAISSIESPNSGEQLKSEPRPTSARARAHAWNIFYVVARLFLARVEIAIFSVGLRFEPGQGHSSPPPPPPPLPVPLFRGFSPVLTVALFARRKSRVIDSKDSVFPRRRRCFA